MPDRRGYPWKERCGKGSALEVYVKPLHLCMLTGLFVFVVGGCRTMEEGPEGTSLPPGSSMTLLVPFTVPADRARVGLPTKDGGQPASGYEVRCLLEVENLGRVPQEIPAGEYRIEKTRTERTYFVDEDQTPYLVAANGLLLAGEKPTPMYRVTNVFFEPGQPASLYRLGCSRLGGRDSPYVTIDEIEALLAGVVEFSSPAPVR